MPPTIKEIENCLKLRDHLIKAYEDFLDATNTDPYIVVLTLIGMGEISKKILSEFSKKEINREKMRAYH